MSPSTFELSSDFTLVYETRDPIKILLLLRNRWAQYSKWLVADENSLNEAFEHSKAGLRKTFANMRVPCRGEETALLKDTVIPLGELFPGDIDSLYLLDIPEPQDPRWKYLTCFGVVTEAGIGPIIQCLFHIRDSDVASTEQVLELYHLVQAQAVPYSDVIR